MSSTDENHEKLVILIVEDDRIQRYTLRDKFKRHGFRVHVASTSNRAIKASTEHEFNVVVLDVQLRNETSLGFARHIRSLQPWAFIVGLSAYPKLEGTARMHDVADIFFEKRPDNFEDILRAILEGTEKKKQILEKWAKTQITSTKGSEDPHSSIENKEIFISYSSSDYDTYVTPLVSRLTLEGYSVWLDKNRLDAGVDWLDEINVALTRCSAMVLCVTPRALTSRYVKMEYRYFVDQSKPLIPIICETTSLPVELRGIQYLPFSALDKLIQRLTDLLN